MAQESVVYVLAAQLKHYMSEARISGNQLAKDAGISQTSLGFILDPDRRQPTKSGKQKGPTLVQIEKIAGALKVPVWELLFPMPEDGKAASPRERELHHRIIHAYRELESLAREAT